MTAQEKSYLDLIAKKQNVKKSEFLRNFINQSIIMKGE